MNLYSKVVQEYLENNTSPRSELLKDLDRRTYVEKLMPQMISGHVQGKLLTMISSLINAKRTLEIGTFTGYATVCLAEGLGKDGLVYTIEKNPEYKDLAEQFWGRAKLEEKIIQHIGDAIDIIPKLKEDWDLVFLDAAKRKYLDFYNLVFPQVKVGGLIMADNVLWSGKVITDPKDTVSQKLIEFNTKINEDPRVENVIVPLRDGITLIRKISQ